MSKKFGEALLRLKQQTQLHSDKAIAELLGLSEKAFSARKTRDVFPEDKLFALAAKRPDLEIDVAYVLAGSRQPPFGFDYETGLRLQTVRSKIKPKRSVVEMAEALGMPVDRLNAMEASETVPTKQFLDALRKTFKVRSEYVLSGSGPVFEPPDDEEWSDPRARGENNQSEIAVSVHYVTEPRDAWRTATSQAVRSNSTHPRDGREPPKSALLPTSAREEIRPLVLSLRAESDGPPLDYEVIPKIMGYATAGAPTGADMDGEPMALDRAGELAMTYEWLGRNLHHTTGNLASIQVQGDSMSPTLLDGDTIIIDRGVREATVDGIYVIGMQGSRLVKRLQRRFDKSLVIISDNQAYEKETIPRGNVAEIEVIGRMVWPRVR